MSQDKPVAAQEPIAWMHGTAGRFEVIHAEVKKLWERVGQPAQFAKEVVSCKVDNYTIPLYSHAVPCARCAELEERETILVPANSSMNIENHVLQAKITEQAAEIERLKTTIEEQKLSIGALNITIGGQDSTTLENITEPLKPFGYYEDEFGFNFPDFFANQEDLVRLGILIPLYTKKAQP